MIAYKPYPAYKDSGVPWLGKVPEGWEVLPLKRITRLCTERAESRLFPIGLEHIESWSGRLIAPSEDPEFEGDGTAFQKSDILFGKLRPYLAKAWLATCQGEAVGDFHVIRVQSPHHPAFVQRILLSQDAISLIDGSTYGAKMPRASWDFIGGLPIPIPRPNEQTAIAAYLDRETAKIDALIAAQRRLIDLLREKRSALISHAVTKGLNPDAPMKESGVPWLGKVPEHWVVCRLKHGISEMDSGGTPDTSNTNYWSDNDDGIPWVTIGDMSGVDIVSETSKYVSNLGIQDKGLHLFPKGALLFSMYASLGHVAEIAMCATTNQAILGLIPTPLTRQDFMKRWLQFLQTYLVEIASRNTQANLNAEKVRNLPFVMIGESEQAAIAAYLDRETAKIDILIAKTEKAIELAQERRSALISAAVTGKIDVREAA